MYNLLRPFLSIGISLSLHVMNLIVVILGFVEVIRNEFWSLFRLN
jgi:hypothetical protein